MLRAVTFLTNSFNAELVYGEGIGDVVTSSQIEVC